MQSRRGFTLVEMATVLVVIGMILGVVMVGRNLLRSSELNSVLVDVDSFKKALAAFDEKYEALPGDFASATTYWSSSANGDGNGKIGDFVNGTGLTEYYRAWQHLANAGMIPGNYTGVTGSGSGTHSVPGSNVPASRVQGGGYTLLYFGYYAGDGNWFAADYGHAIFFGSPWANNNTTFAPIITAEEADSIDNKVDDGKPGTGSVMSHKSTSPYLAGCTTTAVASSSAYAVSSAGRLCALYFTKVSAGDAQ